MTEKEPDWADLIAINIGVDALPWMPSNKTLNDIAAALRKAKADGMRQMVNLANDVSAVMDKNSLNLRGFLYALTDHVKKTADKIERGE